MSGASYQLEMSYTLITPGMPSGLDRPLTHPNAEAFSYWGETLVVVHDEEYFLWKDNVTASDGLLKALKNSDSTLLEEEIKEAGGTVAIQQGGYVHKSVASNSPQELIHVTKEQPFITVLVKLENSPDWFTGTRLNFFLPSYSSEEKEYTDDEGTFVFGRSIRTFPYDAGYDSRNYFLEDAAAAAAFAWEPIPEQFLIDPPNPVRWFGYTANDTSLWADTFDYGCGSDHFPIIEFRFRQQEASGSSGTDYKVAFGVTMGALALLSMVSVVLALKLRNLGRERKEGSGTA